MEMEMAVTSEKKVYRTPVLAVYGNIRELTLAKQSGTKDNNAGQGQFFSQA